MKKFIKDNFVLVVGLALPVTLIVFFFVATVIPKSLSVPPEYEMVFTTVDYRHQNSSDYVLDFIVKNQHLMIKAKKQDDKHRNYNTKILMAYSGKTNIVREIEVDADAVGANAMSNAIILNKMQHVKINTNRVSPDGYKLEQTGYGSGGLLRGLFGGSRHNSDYRLKKGSVAYTIPDNEANYYYRQVKFLGWIIKE